MQRLLICIHFRDATVDLDALLVFCTLSPVFSVWPSSFALCLKPWGPAMLFFFSCLCSTYTQRTVSKTLLLSAGCSSLCNFVFYHCPWEITLAVTPHMKEVGERKPPSFSGNVCFLSGFPRSCLCIFFLSQIFCWGLALLMVFMCIHFVS